MKCYLSFAGDCLSDADLYDSLKDAVWAFERVAEDLDRFGQQTEASIHFYDRRVHDAPHCNEYPDRVLSLGPRGGVRCERT